MKLDKKVAVVTGGNSGIGFASAKALAAAGARVALTGRRKDAVDAAGRELGERHLALVADAAEAGLVTLARVLASEVGGRGIRVNAISPGFVQTPIFGKIGLTDEQKQAMVEQFGPRIALQRVANPEDIADVVVFLASDAARYVTAEELVADGGVSRG